MPLDLAAGKRKHLPLSGIRVVEFATYVAVPSAGTALAQLGADVIRIDPIHGAHDRTRWPLSESGTSMYWAGLNKGKRSIAIDVSSEQGRGLIAELATAQGEGGGIFIHNQAGRDWLDDCALRQRRPDLVHVMLEGRRGGGGALDYTVNARTGLPLMTGDVETQGVVNHVLPAWDLLAGAEVRTAVLAALANRLLTGAGSFVALALEDVAVSALADLGWLADAQLSGRDRERQGTHVYGTWGDAFSTRDERWVFVMAMTERQWGALKVATGTQAEMDALSERLNTRLDTDTARYRARHEISAVLAPWFASRDHEDALNALSSEGVLAELYTRMTELVRDLDLADPDALVGLADQPGQPSMLTSRGAARWNDSVSPLLRAPALGEDGWDVLSEVLGLAPSRIEELTREGVICIDAP